MKRILILGHTGFVGKRIYLHLKKKYPTLDVVGISSKDIDLTNVADSKKLAKYLDLETCVIMCSGIKSNYGDNLETYSKNVLMAENICRLISAHPVKKFMFFSSVAVYGVFVNDLSISEKTQTLPDTYYAQSKVDTEQLLSLEFSKPALKNSSLIFLRTPTIYGPGEKIIAPTPSGFINTYLDGNEVTLWGDGSELREFLYIDDIVTAVDLLIHKDFSGPLNLSSCSHSYTEAIDLISKLMGKKLNVHSKPRTKEKVSKVYDISLFKSLFPNFKFTPLEQGLNNIYESSKRSKCLMCSNTTVRMLIDLGLQPVSNNFLSSATEKETEFALSLGQCRQCGLVQLVDKAPWQELVPKHKWITYLEPEEHLDTFAQTIKHIAKIDSSSKIIGVSFKDSSLLERLGQNVQNCLIDNKNGVETIQANLTSEKITKDGLAGKYDVVIARHIIEHAYDLEEFMKALVALLKPNGHLVLEVPDCAKALETNNYPIIWEEHLSYFTPETFRKLIDLSGLSVDYSSIAIYPLESSLIAIGKKTPDANNSEEDKKAPQNEQAVAELKKEIARAENFASSFENMTADWKEYIGSKGKVVIMGAGHFACAFTNYLGLKNISFVVDDNPKKKGLFMPGSKLPILGSEKLKEADLCLLSVNPRNEQNVAEKNKPLLKQGAILQSIFSESSFELPLTQGRLEVIGPEVYRALDAIVRVGRKEIEFITQRAHKSNRKRARICFHKDSSEALHEMLIAALSGGYVRPHKHANKNESFHMIEGELDVIIFDDDGNVSEVIELGKYGSGKEFYYRITEGIYHTILVKTDSAIFHETTNGPFNRDDTIFAPWSPEETSPDADSYLKKLKNERHEK